jgi:iron(III) transport system permease protein
MKKLFLPPLMAFFALFLVYPLVTLLGGAFQAERVVNGQAQSNFGFDYFLLVFQNPFYRECFANSFIIAVVTTLVTIALALPLAMLFLRCEFPAKKALNVLLLAILVLPPFVAAIGLKQFLSRYGSLNLILMHLGILSPQHPVDWLGSGGFAGIIILQVLHLYPIMMLSTQAALANIDPSLRDAARNLGAGGWRTFHTITLPLAMPGIFAGSSIVFVAAFTDLGVPLMFDFQTTVPTQIFNLVTQLDNPVGYALVVLTLVVVSILFVLGKKLGEGDYAMMGRASTQAETQVLGGIKGWLCTAAVAGLIFLSLLPHLGVVIQSFAAKWFMTVLPGEWSPQFYGEIFNLKIATVSVRNSLVYATGSAVLDVFLGMVIAWLLVREKFAGRGLLDVLSMLPLALPGLVLAFAYYVTFSKAPLPEAWSGWLGAATVKAINSTWLEWFDPRRNPTLILVIAYAVHRIPFMVRAGYAGLQQTSVTLEEASANLGAGPLRTMWKVTLPLIAANLIAGTLLTFIFAMLDVSNGMILAQESQFFPMTKAIYYVMARITPTASAIACALGVLAMVVLGAGLLLAAKLLGQKMGRLFRA